MGDLSAARRERPPALLERLSQRGRQRSTAQRWLVLGVALLLFVGSGWYAVHSLSGVPLAADWPAWLAAVAALALVSFTVNAVEFAVSAGLLGVRAGLADSFRVSVLGSAANILPIPGAALVRSAALKRMGFGYRAALSATALVGLAWVSTSALIAGGLLAVEGAGVVGAVTFAAGAVGMAASFGLLVSQRSWGGAARTFPLVVAVELASVGTGIVRMWALLRVLGADGSIADASVLTAAGVVASAAGVLPGGLGLRETLSAAVAAAVGLPAAIGLLVAAVDRVVGYAVLAACSAVVLLLRRTPDVTAQLDESDLPSVPTDERGP